MVDRFNSVDETIVSVMYYQSLAEIDFRQRLNKLAVVRNSTHDAETAGMANLVSEHACTLVYREYDFAISHATYQFYENIANVYTIKRVDTAEQALEELSVVYQVGKAMWSCSCMFMSTRLLPCRHVLYIMKCLKLERVIPVHARHPRWLLSSVRYAMSPLSFIEAFREGVVVSCPTPWDM